MCVFVPTWTAQRNRKIMMQYTYMHGYYECMCERTAITSTREIIVRFVRISLICLFRAVILVNWRYNGDARAHFVHIIYECTYHRRDKLIRT